MTCQCRTEEKFSSMDELQTLNAVFKFIKGRRYLDKLRVAFTQTKPYPNAEFVAVVSYIDDFPEY